MEFSRYIGKESASIPGSRRRFPAAMRIWKRSSPVRYACFSCSVLGRSQIHTLLLIRDRNIDVVGNIQEPVKRTEIKEIVVSELIHFAPNLLGDALAPPDDDVIPV